MTSTNRPRAGIALRISDDRKGDRAGVKRHERDCRKLAVALEVEVVEVYEDNSVSAFSGKHRPDYDRLVADIEAGKLDVVLAFHPDRLHRNVEEHEQWIKLVRRTRVRVVTLLGGERDLTKASDRMVARVVAATSAYESELKSERQRDKARELAEQGRVAGGGSRPFGYTVARRKLVPHEAEAVRGAAAKLLAGASQSEVVRWLNDTVKIKTTAGRPWTLSRLRRLLDSAAIAGVRESVVKEDDGTGKFVPVLDDRGRPVREVTNQKAAWPAIVTREEHDRLRAILSNVRRHRAPTRYLLTGGLAVCDLCGTPLMAQPRPDHKSYRCPQKNAAAITPGCGVVRIRGDWLEEHVVAQALHWATDPDVIASRRAQREELDTEAAGVRARLAQLETDETWLNDFAVETKMRPAEYRRKLGELERERDGLRRQLARVESAEEQVTSVDGYEEARRRFDGLTFNERRAVLRSLLVEVRVKRAVVGRNFFDPDRVVIRPDWGPVLDKVRRLGEPDEADFEPRLVDVEHTPAEPVPSPAQRV